jgi:predicted ATP-dependent serine protease
MRKILTRHYSSDILIGEMKVIKSNSKGFQRVKDVKIPEVYNRRFKIGRKDLDDVFGGSGFLPGMTFMLAASAGSGKTTCMLQMLELLEKTGKKTAYVSGEEATAQLAFSCKRLGVELVSVANMTVIEDIFDVIAKDKYDIVILDSFPALTSRKKLNGRRLEEYVSNYITSKAKELEVVVGTIQHMTKMGNFKGTTLFSHSVDCTIMMEKSKEDPSVRIFNTTKNRFGSTNEICFYMTSRGFDFEKVEVQTEEDQPRKKGKSAEYKEKVLNTIKVKGQIDLKSATQLLECSLKAQTVLRDLCLMGLVAKEGRGQKATFSLIQTT